MFRFMRKREGFTLIELMMVVAVIGILAAVLVPRIGNSKNSAKLSGVESNVRAAQSAVEANIGRFQANVATNAANFATRVSNSCNGLVNPFTNVQNGATAAAIPTAPAGAVVVVNVAATAPTAADNDLAMAGAVIVTFSLNTNAVDVVTITPFDDAGNIMTATTVNR